MRDISSLAMKKGDQVDSPKVGGMRRERLTGLEIGPEEIIGFCWEALEGCCVAVDAVLELDERVGNGSLGRCLSRCVSRPWAARSTRLSLSRQAYMAA